MRVEPSKIPAILSPRLVVLITTLNSKQGMNVAPGEFIIPANFFPPVVAVSLPVGGQTYKNIKHAKDFVVNIMSRKYLKEVEGSVVRYQEGVNKIRQIGLHHFSSQLVRAPRIKEAKAWLECKFVDEKILKDHVVVFGEVVLAEVSEDVISEGKIDLSKINPILNIAKNYSIELKLQRKKK